MAGIAGTSGLIHIGGSAVVEITQFTLEESQSSVSITRLSDVAPRSVSGRKTWTLSGTAHWDKADTPQESLEAGASVAVLVYVEGNTTGDREWQGNGIVDSVGIEVPEDDGSVKKTFTITCDNGTALIKTTAA